MLLNVKNKVESTKTGSFVLLNGRTRTGNTKGEGPETGKLWTDKGDVEITVMLNKVKHLWGKDPCYAQDDR